MSSTLLADELVDYAFSKYAEDAYEFADDDSDLAKKSDRSDKLKLALIGLGALGAGGLAVWGLSGDAGKRLGAWIDGKPSTPLVDAASSSISHGIGAGLGAAALRSGTAGAIVSNTRADGSVPGAKFHTTPASRLQTATLTDTGLLPQSTPNRVATDIGALTTPAADTSWYRKATTFVPTSNDARATMSRATEYLSTADKAAAPTLDDHKPIKVPKNATPEQKAAINEQNKQRQAEWNADKALINGLSAGASPTTFVNSLQQFAWNDKPTPMKASASGLYVLDKGGKGYTPLSASGLSADQVVAAAQEGRLVQNYIENGAYKQVPFAQGAVDLASQIHVARDVTVQDASMSPQRQVELYMLKQQSAPKLVEYATQLEALAKADPKLRPLYQAVLGDLVNTHNVGTFAETGYRPEGMRQPSTERTLRLVQDRVGRRAQFTQTLSQAMYQNRYQPGPLRAAGRALRTGGAVGLTSFGLQQLFGAARGRYIGEEE